MEIHIATTLLLLATLLAVLTLPWEKWTADAEILKQFLPNDKLGESEQSTIQTADVFDIQTQMHKYWELLDRHRSLNEYHC